MQKYNFRIQCYQEVKLFQQKKSCACFWSIFIHFPRLGYVLHYFRSKRLLWKYFFLMLESWKSSSFLQLNKVMRVDVKKLEFHSKLSISRIVAIGKLSCIIYNYLYSYSQHINSPKQSIFWKFYKLNNFFLQQKTSKKWKIILSVQETLHV